MGQNSEQTEQVSIITKVFQIITNRYLGTQIQRWMWILKENHFGGKWGKVYYLVT